MSDLPHEMPEFLARLTEKERQTFLGQCRQLDPEPNRLN